MVFAIFLNGAELECRPSHNVNPYGHFPVKIIPLFSIPQISIAVPNIVPNLDKG